MNKIISACLFGLLLTLSAGASLRRRAPPFHEAELIFPLETWYNHASAIVECPNGDLLVCWFHGSGERTADDVKVEGARLRRGAKAWKRFTMADTPSYPDTNPTMFIDPQQRLWLMWPTILANERHTALRHGSRGRSLPLPFDYPGARGSLHASYSYHLNKKDVPLDGEGKPARKSIKHAHFNEDWVMQGDMK